MRESSSDQIGDVTTRTQPQQRVRTQTGQATLESSVSLVTRQSWHSQPQASAPSCVPGVLKAPHPGLLLLRWLLSGKTPLTPILCRGYRDSWEQSPRLSSVTLTTCRLGFLIYRMERIETLMPASQDCVRIKCNTIVFKCFSVCKLLFYVKMFSQLWKSIMRSLLLMRGVRLPLLQTFTELPGSQCPRAWFILVIILIFWRDLWPVLLASHTKDF